MWGPSENSSERGVNFLTKRGKGKKFMSMRKGQVVEVSKHAHRATRSGAGVWYSECTSCGKLGVFVTREDATDNFYEHFTKWEKRIFRKHCSQQSNGTS